MDRATHALLTAELEERWADIAALVDVMEGRRSRYADSDEGVEAMAYQLHNLYGACERLLEVVAIHFENYVSGERYRTDLLRRMKIEIRDVRPALLSTETFGLLDELRRFRHFFRHAYGARLESGKVGELVESAPQLRHLLERDRKTFLDSLTPPAA